MSRTAPMTSKCRWCNRILVNNLWLLERREYHVKYRLTICAQCVDLDGATVVKPMQPLAWTANRGAGSRSDLANGTYR